MLIGVWHTEDHGAVIVMLALQFLAGCVANPRLARYHNIRLDLTPRQMVELFHWVGAATLRYDPQAARQLTSAAPDTADAQLLLLRCVVANPSLAYSDQSADYVDLVRLCLRQLHALLCHAAPINAAASSSEDAVGAVLRWVTAAAAAAPLTAVAIARDSECCGALLSLVTLSAGSARPAVVHAAACQTLLVLLSQVRRAGKTTGAVFSNRTCLFL